MTVQEVMARMASERQTPAAPDQQGGQSARKSTGGNIDLDQLTQELAQELGIDPASLQSQGQAGQWVWSYEAQTHGRTQQSDNR